MKSKKVFIFINGKMGDENSIKNIIQDHDYIVAVDGGYQHLKNISIMPDVIIGDMDSIDPDDLCRLQKENIEIMQYPREKDETDLEIALNHVINLGYDKIVIVAAFGGRLDQMLTNLLMLKKPMLNDRTVIYFDGLEYVHLISSSLIIRGSIGDRVSLIPFFGPVHGISTMGLKYQLVNESLYPEQSRGVSNVITEKEVKIEIKSGQLICIHTNL